MGVICPECRRRKEVTCPVCMGSRRDPRNTDKKCTKCIGKGTVECFYCVGTGEVPGHMFTDRPR